MIRRLLQIASIIVYKNRLFFEGISLRKQPVFYSLQASFVQAAAPISFCHISVYFFTVINKSRERSLCFFRLLLQSVVVYTFISFYCNKKLLVSLYGNCFIAFCNDKTISIHEKAYSIMIYGKEMAAFHGFASKYKAIYHVTILLYCCGL